MSVTVTVGNGYQPNYDLDLDFGREGEESIAAILRDVFDDGDRIEVKRDRRAAETKNLYVEVLQQRSGTVGYKKSGISISTADYWFFIYGEQDDGTFGFLGVPTGLLYEAAKKRYEETRRFVDGGADGDCPTKGILLRIADVALLATTAPRP